MTRFWPRLAVASFALATAALSAPSWSVPLAAQELGIAVGSVAPGAALETLDGKPVDLKTYFGKKPVLLEFWATWCPTCKQLEPAVIAATKKYGAQITFVTVAVSVNQSPQRVAAWHKQNPIPTVMLYDRHANAGEAYDVPATSYVVIVNAAGKVVYTGVGGSQDLDAAIRKALN
jgi:thiol-disulfide isomerase/thioredoxin